MTFEELEKLIVGKRITAIYQGCSIHTGSLGIESIKLKGKRGKSIMLEFSGAADCVMLASVDVIGEDGLWEEDLAYEPPDWEREGTGAS